MGFNIFHLRFARQNRNQNHFINSLKCNYIHINIGVLGVQLGVRFQLGDYKFLFDKFISKTTNLHFYCLHI